MSGPGGVGKGTIAKRLIETDPRLWLSTSWTTRLRRPGEDGTAYRFVDRETFQAHLDADGFVEHNEFLGNLYGTPVPKAPPGRDVLLEIDVNGARQVRARDEEALLVFIVAPSLEELEARLVGRGDDPDHVRKRIAESAREQKEAAELGAVTVVNDVLERAVDEVLQHIQRDRERLDGR